MRRGGLVAYVEDLMTEQVRRGHEVAYFFTGRYYPYLRGPRLRRWRRDGVAMLEVVNSPLHDHGRQPDLELSEPRIERMFRRMLEERRPDVVHVQELAGLPASLLAISRTAGIPTVFTLQDYYPLCPTFKLLDSEGKVCLRRDVGADCVDTIAQSRSRPELLFKATLVHDLARLPVIRRFQGERRDREIDKLATRVAAHATSPTPLPGKDPQFVFQGRRDVFIQQLNRTDRLVAMSSRVAEIYHELGVDADRLHTMQLTLRHIERLRPRVATGTAPVTFGTLAGLESEEKGARVLLDAMKTLEPAVQSGLLRLVVFGGVDPPLLEEALSLPGVEVAGLFAPRDLDSILDEVDVGIMPSVWEEAYGFAGMEFVAKGIPVIANQIGGMVDYVREGETGWLNRSCSAEELARIVQHIVENRHQVVELNEKLRAGRESLVKPMASHGDEMDAIYGELLAERYDPAP